jgi:glycosyltransferase involved in cell wall biosynthesis
MGLPDGAPLIGFAANFHPDKAPLDFVAVAAQIAAAQPEAHFCMAGHGPLEEAVRASVRKAGLEGKLRLLGFRKDILQVLASCDLLLLTSVAREASSTVLKQAAALGMPVVATDLGGTCEIVEDGRTGILAPPGDVAALARGALLLLNDRPRAKEMGQAGRQKVLQAFTPAAVAEKTEDLYHQILSAGTGR